jgi:hypothetical protein
MEWLRLASAVTGRAASFVTCRMLQLRRLWGLPSPAPPLIPWRFWSILMERLLVWRRMLRPSQLEQHLLIWF